MAIQVQRENHLILAFSYSTRTSADFGLSFFSSNILTANVWFFISWLASKEFFRSWLSELIPEDFKKGSVSDESKRHICFYLVKTDLLSFDNIFLGVYIAIAAIVKSFFGIVSFKIKFHLLDKHKNKMFTKVRDVIQIISNKFK